MKSTNSTGRAGASTVHPFLTVYAKQLGYSSFVVGTVYTVLSILVIVTKLITGWASDRFKIRRSIFLVSLSLAAFGCFSLMFLPSLPKTYKVGVIYNSSSSWISICNNTGTCSAWSLKDTDEVFCDVDCSNVKLPWSGIYVHPNASQQAGACLYIPIFKCAAGNQTQAPFSTTNEDLNDTCLIWCNAASLNDIISTTNISDDRVFFSYQFWLFFACYAVAYTCDVLVIYQSDAVCSSLLDKKSHHYGFQRMYGSLGWGLLSLIAGPLIDYCSRGKPEKNYVPSFGMGCGILLLCWLVAFRLRYKQHPKQAKIFKDVPRLIFGSQFFVFLVSCIYFGSCFGLIWTFLYWLIEDLANQQGCTTIGWIKTIQSLHMAVQSLLGELPFFFLSSWILKKLGHGYAMSLLLFFNGIRFILYTIIGNPWYSPPIAIISGGIYGIYFSIMTSYTSITAPKGAETITLAFASAMFEAGVSIGSFSSGLLIKTIGTQKTFKLFGYASLIISILHAVLQYVLKRSKDTNETHDSLLQGVVK